MANFCTNCGKPVSENVRFCTNCGHPLTDNRVKKASGEAQKTEQMQQTSRPDMKRTAPVSPSGKYCTKCGSMIPAGAKYCTGCGHLSVGSGARSMQEPLNQIRKTQSVQKVQPDSGQKITSTGAKSSVSTAGTKYCVFCGKELPAGSAFCVGCGKKAGTNSGIGQAVSKEPSDAVRHNVYAGNAANNRNTAADEKRRAGNVAASIDRSTNTIGNIFRLAVPSAAGEFEAGAFQASGFAAGMAGKASQILSPGKTISAFFGSLGGKLKALFTGKNAKGLIVAVALAVIWIILLMMRREEMGGPVRNVLDVLFFGQGGVSNNVLCMIGGALGKFTFAAAAAALVCGGAKKIGPGFKNLFTGKNFRKNTIGLYLLGAGAALLFYQFFAWTASYKDIMASVAGAAVSIMALGGKTGLLRKLASSVTVKKNGTQRIGQGEKSNALLAGLALGFVLGVPLSFTGFGLLPLAVGGSILVVGLILALIFGNSTGTGRQAGYGNAAVRRGGAFMMLIAALLLPLLAPIALKADVETGEYEFSVSVSMKDTVPGYWYDADYYDKNGSYVSASYDDIGTGAEDGWIEYEDKALVEIKDGYITITIPSIDNRLVYSHGFDDDGWTENEMWLSRSQIILSGKIEEEEPPQGSFNGYFTATLHSELAEFTEETTKRQTWTETGYQYGYIYTYTPDDMGHAETYVFDMSYDNGYANIFIDLSCPGRATMESFDWTENLLEGYRDFDGITIHLESDHFDYVYTAPPQVEEKDPGIEQEEYNPANPNPGEEEDGVIINPAIVENKTPSLPGAILGGLLAIIAAFGGVLNGSDTEEESEDPEKARKKTYKMYVNKDFGDRLRKGEEPRWVYARIVEILENGPERRREDLTEKITAFSGDDSLDVRGAGMTSTGYYAARVSVPEDNTRSEGLVTFRFQGEGGVFTRHLIFRLSEPLILVSQPNLGLPAHHEKEERLEFEVFDMPENVSVHARIDANGYQKAYTVEVVPKEKEKNHYYAVIRDTLKTDEKEPGTTQQHTLYIEAEAVNAAGKKERAEIKLPILRIHMGLVLHMEADAIGCYLKLREGTREKAVVRGAGTNLALGIDPTKVSGLGAVQSLTETGIQAMMEASLSTEIRDDDKEVPLTTGTVMLLRWNDENEKDQYIEMVAVYPEKECTVKALKLKNDVNAMLRPAGEADQKIVDKLKICCFATNSFDEQQNRIVKFCCTEAALDQPTRYRAELEIKASYRGKEYTAKKNVLLHSVPYRVYENFQEKQDTLKYDQKIRDQLNHIMDEIYDRYYLNLSSVHNLIDRMLTGYNEAFGFDKRQVERVLSAYTRYLRGELAGAKAERRSDSYVATITDEIDAVLAFVEGMRDNGGILGRVALGVCTFGYSEVLFFGLELKDKMKEKVFKCKGGDDEFGFWDGVWLGTKEYSKQVAQEVAFGAAFKAGNTVISGFVSEYAGKQINIAQKAAAGWKNLMTKADSALKANSKSYKGAAGILDKITGYTNQSAKTLSNTMKKSLDMDARADAKAEMTIAQRRAGNQNWSQAEIRDMEIHVLSQAEGKKKVLELINATKAKAVARQSGTLGEAMTQYEKAWTDVKLDKNAFKYLKNLDDPYAQTVRAEFTRHRKQLRAQYMERVLDDIALTTGKNRNSLYVESATSGKAWKEDAGLSLGEDYDVTIRERVYSESGDLLYNSSAKDVIIDQTVGNNALVREVYKTFHGGAEPPSLEVAERFAKDVDVTYVSPWMDQGNKYEIEFNPDAYPRLQQMIDPSKFGEKIDVLGLTKATIRHKGMEWVNLGRQEDALAETFEKQAEKLFGAEKTLRLQEATAHRMKAHSYYVEGIRQVNKIANNIIAPRNAYHEAKGFGNKYTADARELVALGNQVQKGWDPKAFFHTLETDYGISFEGFVDKIADCLV